MAYNALATPVVITSSIVATGWTTGLNMVTLAGIPSSATGVILDCGYTSGHSGTLGVRMSGLSDTYGASQATTTNSSTASHAQFIAGVGTGGNANQIDLYCSALSGFGATVLGYFDSRAQFASPSVVMGALNASAYSNFNIVSADASAAGAVAAIVTCNGFTGVWGCRYGQTSVDSSADDWTTSSLWNNGPCYAIVGVDSNGYFNARSEGQTNDLVLLGWINSGLTWNTNAVSRTPGTAGSSQALSTSGDTSPTAFLYQMKTGGAAYSYQLAASGLTTPTGAGPSGSNGQMTSGSPPTANISNTGLSVYELGYFTAPSGGSPSNHFGLLMGVGQ